MPEINIQNFEGSRIEKDIADLSKEIAEKKASPESGGVSDKEILKNSLYDKIYAQKASQVVSPSSSAQNDDDKYLPGYLKDSSEGTKELVEKLINLTFREGIEKGIGEAIKEGAFVLDAYHDTLTGKLHEELERRKII